jgi:hypothetical protein
MPRFRKKPIVVEAICWTGDNLREIIDFTGLHPSAARWSWDEYEAVVRDEGLKIFTLEGPHIASAGDWIVRGVKGEFYPVKPDIFATTYSPVSEGSATTEPRHSEALGLALDYIALLTLDGNRLGGFLIVHRMTTPPLLVDEGARLRALLYNAGVRLREARSNFNEGGRIEYHDIPQDEWH